MKKKKLWPLRVLAFILGFLLINQLISLLFYKQDTSTRLTMHDYKRDNKSRGYIVGSSWSKNQLSPAIMREENDEQFFIFSFASVQLPEQYAMFCDLIKEKELEYCIFEYDARSYRYDDTGLVKVCANLSPYLSLGTKLRYAFRESMRDGNWLDRFFDWRVSHVGKPGDVPENFKVNTDEDFAYEIACRDLAKHPNYEYESYGHFWITIKDRKEFEFIKTDQADVSQAVLPEDKYEVYCKVKQKCDELGIKLAIYTPPLPYPSTRIQNGCAVMQRFCDENDIPYFNFVYAKETVLPFLKDYSMDGSHIDPIGSKQFSRVFGKVLGEYMNGDNWQDYFYTQDELFEHVNSFVGLSADSYTESEQINICAFPYCGHHVELEYSFYLLNDDGSEELLQDYSTSTVFSGQTEQLQGKTVKIFARDINTGTVCECELSV